MQTPWRQKLFPFPFTALNTGWTESAQVCSACLLSENVDRILTTPTPRKQHLHLLCDTARPATEPSTVTQAEHTAYVV